MRVEMKLPVKKPIGNNKKYSPNSVAGRCKSSVISEAAALAITMNAPVLNPLVSTKALKRSLLNSAR